MDFQPIGTDRARRGRVVRVFGGPQWVRPDGETWRRIEDVVSIRQVAFGYRLDYGDEWVELRPDAGSSLALAAATRRTICRGRAFGPVLDAKAAPDSLAWRVAASAGVERREDLWLLGEPDGVPLGLHLRDWRAKFGKRCIVDGDRITLDLTDAKAAAEGREIDLDPAISGTSETGWTSHAPGTQGDSWAAARSVGTSAWAGEPGTAPRIFA